MPLKKKEEKAAPKGREPRPGTGREDLDNLVSALRSKFGEEAIMKLGESKPVDVDVIPSGSLSLNLALGVGGFPRGRVIEIFGPEASGKTTLALTVVAQAQKRSGKAAFIDAEHALDPEYAKNIGVDVKNLLISQPDNGEEALNILESLVRSGMIDVIVVDSVAALTPKAEIEGEMGAQFIGLQARLMSQAMRKLAAITARAETLIIFTNQIREKIGMMGWVGDPTTTPGGRALKFYASVRIDIRRIAQIKKGDQVVGNRTRAKVVKNKVAPPFRVAEFDILYGKGISYAADVLNLATNFGVVKRSGSSYMFGEERLGVGADNSRIKLEEDKKLLAQIEKLTLAAIEESAKS